MPHTQETEETRLTFSLSTSIKLLLEPAAVRRFFRAGLMVCTKREL